MLNNKLFFFEDFYNYITNEINTWRLREYYNKLK